MVNLVEKLGDSGFVGNIRRNRLDNVHVDGLDYVGQGLGNLLLVGVATPRNVSEGYS